MKNKTLLTFFGHHKSATGWINSILRMLCFDLNLKHGIVHTPAYFKESLSYFTKANKIDVLSYTNANYKYLKDLENFRGFHIVRDPRDIVISAYFSHIYSHPTKNWKELNIHRRNLQKVNKDEGLMLEMEFSQQEFAEMYRWEYSGQNILEIKMEDLTSNPYQEWINICVFLDLIDLTPKGYIDRAIYKSASLINNVYRRSRNYMPLQIPILPFSAPIKKTNLFRLKEILDQNSFANKSGNRTQGEENVYSHYRKGVAGDWRNHFSKEHIIFFKNHYNDLLLKLGYESHPNW